MTERSMEVNDGPFEVTHEFICADCGDDVYKFGHHDGLPVCATCRYIREHPELPEEAKRLLRGDPDTSDIPEAGEDWFNKATMPRTIVKVQTPLFSSDAIMPDRLTPALIYDEANTHIAEQLLSEPARTLMGNDVKAFFEAVWDGAEWQLGKRVGWQPW